MGPQTGANRRIAAPRAAGGFGALVGIGAQINASWGRRWVGIDVRWGRRRVRIGASRRRAQRGVAWRWWAGRPASPQTVEITRWSWRRFWTAPTPIRAVKGMRSAIKARSADAGCHQDGRWGFVVPPTPAMAHRGATKDRIGVGAVQNRPTLSCAYLHRPGDAGQPAHQRPKTPHCARHHHDRFAPR
jgi:hypothetical protein